jgi:hypothetical protein
MRRVQKGFGVVMGVAVLTTAFAARAGATCAELPADLLQAALAGTSRQKAAGMPAGSVTPQFAAAAAAAPLAAARPAEAGPSIVGFWHVQFIASGNAGIPDGVILDDGFVQWHSDGPEIMNSSREPGTGNFCMGVWENGGQRTFRLNHFAMGWDNTGQLCTPPAGKTVCYPGVTNIRETVSVTPQGDTYDGTLTIDQYDLQNHLLFRITGTVKGERITP